MITVRVLDVAAVALAVALGSALVVWWARPETLFLILLGVDLDEGRRRDRIDQ